MNLDSKQVNIVNIVNMLRLSCLLLVLVASSLGASIPTNKIVGGSDAANSQFPWIISIRSNNRHICGGSIMNQRWIITAAHCLFMLPIDSMTVETNSLFLNSNGDHYGVNRTILHPDYNFTWISNDIGLIQVTGPILYSPRVRPIALPTADFTAVDHPAVVAGWGAGSFPGTAFNHLQFLNVSIVSQKECRASSWRVTDSNICSFTRVNQGLCHGDSGGPMTVDGVLVGVVSFANPCAVGTPDAYVRVWSFVPWINANAV